MMHISRLFVAGILLVASIAAAEDVGSVASVNGTAEVGRGGAWAPAEVGGPIQLGDQLRTGADGEMRVVFRDDSVIDLTANSTLVVDQQVFDPSASRFSSIVRLVQGKARALVSGYYKTPGAAYEVETPTAVAGVRGTTFLVAYNADTDATEVIGIRGQVEVRNLAERVGGTVFVSAQETTTVMRDEPPTAPEPIEEQRFRIETEGMAALALGNLARPGAAGLAAGASVPAAERAPSTAGTAGQVGHDQLKNPGDVAGQPLSVVGSTRGSLGVPF